MSVYQVLSGIMRQDKHRITLEDISAMQHIDVFDKMEVWKSRPLQT